MGRFSLMREPSAQSLAHRPGQQRRAETFQRLQIGLAGLGAVVMMVSLANVVMDRTIEEAPTATQSVPGSEPIPGSEAIPGSPVVNGTTGPAASVTGATPPVSAAPGTAPVLPAPATGPVQSQVVPDLPRGPEAGR